MRLLRGLFAGIVSLAALGGGLAHAQESAGRYWVNPALTGEWRDQVLSEEAEARRSEGDDVSLGFTLNGFGGVNGSIELGRVTLSPDADRQRITAYGHSELGGSAVDEAVGEASLNWSLTDRLQLSTSYRREEADPTLFAGTSVFEDEISGGVTYALTPRFAVSARGMRRQSADSNVGDIQEFTGDGAALNAEYQFMPYFTGSVNYSYESYDGQEGVLRHDESTLSLSLTGRF